MISTDEFNISQVVKKLKGIRIRIQYWLLYLMNCETIIQGLIPWLRLSLWHGIMNYTKPHQIISLQRSPLSANFASYNILRHCQSSIQSIYFLFCIISIRYPMPKIYFQYKVWPWKAMVIVMDEVKWWGHIYLAQHLSYALLYQVRSKTKRISLPVSIVTGSVVFTSSWGRSKIYYKT